jgi:hypothetical protein
MKLPKRLLVVFLLFLTLGAARPVILDFNGCDVQVTAASTKELNGGFFTITLTARGGQAPYYYLLLDDKSNLVSKDFRNHVFDRLTPGRYRYIVSDTKDCTTEEFIEVK